MVDLFIDLFAFFEFYILDICFFYYFFSYFFWNITNLCMSICSCGFNIQTFLKSALLFEDVTHFWGSITSDIYWKNWHIGSDYILLLNGLWVLRYLL